MRYMQNPKRYVESSKYLISLTSSQTQGELKKINCVRKIIQTMSQNPRLTWNQTVSSTLHSWAWRICGATMHRVRVVDNEISICCSFDGGVCGDGSTSQNEKWNVENGRQWSQTEGVLCSQLSCRDNNLTNAADMAGLVTTSGISQALLSESYCTKTRLRSIEKYLRDKKEKLDLRTRRRHCNTTTMTLTCTGMRHLNEHCGVVPRWIYLRLH